MTRREDAPGGAFAAGGGGTRKVERRGRVWDADRVAAIARASENTLGGRPGRVDVARRPRSRPHLNINTMVMTPVGDETRARSYRRDGRPRDDSFLSSPLVEVHLRPDAPPRRYSARDPPRTRTALARRRPFERAIRPPPPLRVRLRRPPPRTPRDVGLSSPRSGRTPPVRRRRALDPYFEFPRAGHRATSLRDARHPRATHPRLHHEVSGSIPGCGDARRR